MKKIILTESDITKIIKKSIEKQLKSDKFINLLKEDHTDNPSDKYEVKKDGDKWSVWEGDVEVKRGFQSEDEAQSYADKKNKEQGLN